jgi:hypothetical protein
MRLSQLYEADETAWLESMSELIKQRRLDKLDLRHLSEYLDDMARRDRKEVTSRLRILVAHLLKWDCQPRKRSRSWSGTITSQRHDLQFDLESKTLRNHAEAVLPAVYAKAVQLAVDETGLPKDQFPSECPYTLQQILGE